MLNDYTNVTPEFIASVTTAAIEAAERLVGDAATAEPVSWEATMLPLETAGEIVTDAYGQGPFLARVHPDKAVQAEAVKQEEILQKWSTDLVFRRDLFEKVAEFAASAEADQLAPTRRRLVEHWMRDFRRAGHELDEATRTALQAKQQRLIELQVAFSKNLDEYEDFIDVTAEQLEGTSDAYRSRLAAGAEPGTYRITMAYPDYVPFMEQGKDRELRRRLQHKFWNQAVVANRPLLEEAVALRREMAKLMGYATWAHFAMEPKMADPDAVESFYAELREPLSAKAQTEIATMQDLLERDVPGESIQPWDWNYLDTQQRKLEYGVDPDEVAAYFALEPLIDGMFEITGEVFGLTYERIEDTKAWHPDVFLYAIRNRGESEPIAYFYADLFPREGKFGHAAAFPIRYGRRRDDGEYVRPVAAIVANFTKPTGDTPSLLQHSEAVTLWHEFGHILHFCLTTVELARFSGYDTEWDFVEAPSQIMENWMWEPEVLQRFAKHHATGEPIPESLVEKLVAARDLNAGVKTVRQMFLGHLDLGMHATDREVDLDEVYRDAYAITELPFHEGTFFPAAFGHLMGGYDAGYYGYLWAQVYGDDMFSVFSEEGVLSPAVGKRYRDEVLAVGHERDAIDHLRAFLQREPSSDAFLSKLGLD